MKQCLNCKYAVLNSEGKYICLSPKTVKGEVALNNTCEYFIKGN